MLGLICQVVYDYSKSTVTGWKIGQMASSRMNLETRGEVIRNIRKYFNDINYMEVDTPVLNVTPGPEAHIRPFTTDLCTHLDEARDTMYLHASPELNMKLILSQGWSRIFQFAHVFRNGEITALHHPEFAMIEWYQAGADYRDMMDLCAGLVGTIGRQAGIHAFSFEGKACDPNMPPVRISVAEAFARFANGMDVLGTITNPADPDPSAGPLADELTKVGITFTKSDRWEDLFFKVMMDRIEPRLGIGQPTILYDYPACLAVLSKLREKDLRVAERFEIYVCGVELANGCTELQGKEPHKQRFAHSRKLSNRLYGRKFPTDDDFVEIGDVLPPCAGVALGLDRLVMLVTGADRVTDVMWTPTHMELPLK